MERSSRRLELWGGIECTHNRVGTRSFDQLDRSGHATRIGDLDLVAELGIRTLRYPVLWERVVPGGDLADADWSWPDERLGRLRELGIRPLVGLLHHGNGPADTDLLDPAFPERFAAYARAVAERYPWVDAYVPINEPLTTARFAGLYGLWHPHGRDVATMARTLIHQLRATVLALREIRDINPRASFIQNEDLGKVHSTPRLADEARYQNERRWLTFDVLCGRVDDAHPMWPTLREGVSARELERFLEDPLVPDVLGVDHYVTSERYLDEALAAYPDRYHGGNAIERYADAEAVWSLPDGMVRFEGVLRETWDRYGIPLAITEAHLNGTREEQIRWLVETWEAALAVRADGADVRAVTAWSLFGAYDWPTLLTEVRGFYESGAFDLRGPEPRRTALADMMSALASSGPYAHPVLAQPGWWRRPERLIYGPSAGAPVPASADDMRPRRVRRARPIAFVADGGVVTDALRTALEARALAYEEIDVLSGVAADLVADVLSRIGAWAVVDAATFASAFDAAFDEDLLPTRTLATDHVETVIDVHRAVASVAAASSTPMVALSSWLVFAGADNDARDEATRPDATSAVGRAWIDAERTVLEAHPSALVARLGPALGSPVTPYAARDDLRDRPRTAAVTPTFLGDAANAALDLLLDRERGIWHLANVGLAPAALASGVRRSVVLASGRGVLLPPLEDALRRLEEARLPLPVDGRDATVIDEIPA